jgi:CheY-like chemotaxis protein
MQKFTPGHAEGQAIAGRMEAVGQFASSTIHDLSNLLTIMLAASDRLRAIVPADGPEHKDCQLIGDSAARAVKLIHQVLSFSTPKPAVETIFSLRELVARSETVLGALAGATVHLTTTSDGVADMVRADSTHIEQVLFNLVANARDALPGGGQVDVRTQVEHVESPALALGLTPGAYVVLSVSDAGVGMDPETQARAFDPFFTTKAPGRGTGLGLSTVQRIVHSWGGATRIESRPHVGTTVRVFLPIVEGVSSAAMPGDEALAPGGRGSETILIVEDEEAVGELVDEMLTAEGYRTIRVGRPSLALETIRTYAGAIDLLLTDIVMPDMSGIELAAHVVATKPGMRVLYMSGYADHSGARGGVLAEGMRLLSKPFDRRGLVTGVREALDAGAVGQG